MRIASSEHAQNACLESSPRVPAATLVDRSTQGPLVGYHTPHIGTRSVSDRLIGPRGDCGSGWRALRCYLGCIVSGGCWRGDAAARQAFR